MITTVIFDMDGVLVDSEPLWQQARVDAFGMDRLKWTEQDQERIMGTTAQEWAAYLADKLEHAYSISTIINRVVERMEQFYGQSVPLMPGARQVIDQLQSTFRLGLASGSSHRLISAVLKSAGWHTIFEEVLSSDDVQRGKPDPAIYLEITRRMGIVPELAVVIEDSANGILAAYRAGIKVIAIPNAFHSPTLQHATLVLSSLLDLSPEVLLKL